MVETDIGKRIEKLRSDIDHHRFCYYILDKPEIDDYAFDKLYNELVALESQHPQFFSPTSPTQTVGYPIPAESAPVKHRPPLLSLSNAMSDDDLDKWNERLAKNLDFDEDRLRNLEFSCELKIDGLSIALTYEDGVLVRGATRGNGEVGEDVTLNLKAVKSVPHALMIVPHLIAPSQDFPAHLLRIPERLEVRGEIYMPLSSFKQLNADLEESGQLGFANPRNAASGSLRQKDLRKVASRKLAFFAYQAYIFDAEDSNLQKQSTTLKYLSLMGFPTEGNGCVVQGIEEVKEFCHSVKDRRDTYDYQTDGIVVKLNDRRLWDDLGKTSQFPKWAIAFKYPPEEVETTLEEIQFDVGRTGVVTPVANLKPVQLAGTIVKRATLHNADQIARLRVRVGDIVVVRKAGEIIPEIVLAKDDKRDGSEREIVFPTHCPHCGSKLERLEGEVALRCLNTYGCPAQTKRRLEHFASRDAMDIDGVGEVLVDLLVDQKLVQTPADLYRLTTDSLRQLKWRERKVGEGVKEKQGTKWITNVLKAIESSKARPFSNLIHALGIRHIGSSGAEVLADHFMSIDALANATQEDILAIDGMGPAIAQSVVEFFQADLTKKLVSDLRELGVQMQVSESEINARAAIEKTFTGKTFVLTGTLETLDRAQAEKMIKDRGGKASSSVSKKTDYVVAGASAGSKLAKAQELGITVLDEAQFKELMGV